MPDDTEEQSAPTITLLLEQIAAAATEVANVARKIDAIVEAAGGVEGIKGKLAILSFFSSKK